MNRMKVEVYRNLHKNCWSVRDNKTGRVLRHVDEIHLLDADLVVRPAGREKVLREKRKNVHAFAKGEVMAYIPRLPEGWHLNIVVRLKDEYEAYDTTQIIYNPYLYDSFVYVDSEKPIFHAERIYLTKKGEIYVN